MCLAQSANVVSMQSASSHVPEIVMESRSGLFSVLHPIMAETTGEQSIHRVRVWHHFCQRESEKLDVSAKRCDLWAFPPRIRTPWWCKSVTSVGTQAEVCAHQQEETQKTQHLYFFTLSVMEVCRWSPKTTNTVQVCGVTAEQRSTDAIKR